MFDPAGYCLFGENELFEALAGWAIEYSKIESFLAPNDTIKRFFTVVARRPAASRAGEPAAKQRPDSRRNRCA
jgi:tellurite methyltransferase